MEAFFRHHAKRGVVTGVTEEEYNNVYSALEAEYTAAASRQRAGTMEPSKYMKGLQYALDLLESIEPHKMEVQ